MYGVLPVCISGLHLQEESTSSPGIGAPGRNLSYGFWQLNLGPSLRTIVENKIQKTF